MKKALLAIFLLFAISIAILTACNNDEDEPSDITVNTSDTAEKEDNSATSDEIKSDGTDGASSAQTTGSSSETTGTSSNGGSGNSSGEYIDPFGDGYSKPY